MAACWPLCIKSWETHHSNKKSHIGGFQLNLNMLTMMMQIYWYDTNHILSIKLVLSG